MVFIERLDRGVDPGSAIAIVFPHQRQLAARHRQVLSSGAVEVMEYRLGDGVDCVNGCRKGPRCSGHRQGQQQGKPCRLHESPATNSCSVWLR